VDIFNFLADSTLLNLEVYAVLGKLGRLEFLVSLKEPLPRSSLDKFLTMEAFFETFI
jgi:hypothetical protein